MVRQLNRRFAFILALILALTLVAIPAYANVGQGATSSATGAVAATPAAPDAGPYTKSLSSMLNTFVDEDKPTTVNAGNAELKNKTQNDKDKRSLVQFDLSSLPAGPGVTITGATMSFHVTKGQANHAVGIHSLLEAWTESQATWNIRQTAAAWSGGGGGGEPPFPTASVGASVASFTPTTDNSTVDVASAALTALVDDWNDGSVANHGIMLVSSGSDSDKEVKFAKPVRLEVEYSCPTLASIGNFVWNDANNNGIQDGGELGIPGVTVNLLDSTGTTTLQSTQSGNGGTYSFGCVQPGSYIVEFVAPTGIPFTLQYQGNPAVDSDANPGTGRTGLVTVAAAEQNLTVDAGLVGPVIAGGVNGLFYGDGDHARYTLLSEDPGLGSMWGLLDGSTMRVAFLANPAMNDNVFEDVDASPDPTSYMASVGWGENRSAKKLYDSEKLIDITLSCGANIWTWTQSYFCKPQDLNALYGTSLSDPFTGPLQAGLQSLIEFQPASNLPSGASNNATYAFGDCGRDGDTPPPSYTAATSLAWDWNNTNWETDQNPSSDATHWKSPFGANDTPLEYQYPYFDMTHQWEWQMVYEMSFDISACGSNAITIAADSIHNSPSKGGVDATFPPGTVAFYDWGDLPAPYPTTGATGARHLMMPGGPFLGALIDNDADGQPTVAANGDNTDAGGDDEDGVVFVDPLEPGPARIRVTAGTAGFLSAFMDFDNDGTLDPVTVTSAVSVGGGGGTAIIPGSGLIGDMELTAADTYELTITVPPGAANLIYSRFRFTANAGEGGNSTSGAASSGEVEDYLQEIVPPLDVQLASFEASCQSDHPLLNWTTVSELSNTGFNVWRNTSDVTPADLLDFVASQAPGSSQGYDYSWTDSQALPDATYYYWLETIEFNGATELHGPIMASCSVPTAVTLSDLETGSGPGSPLGLAAVLLAVLLAAGLAVISFGRRRTAT